MIKKKDFHFTIENVDYIIRNVPYYEHDEEDLFGIDTCLKMAMIRDLMYDNSIPNDVNFDIVADMELDI